MNIANSAGVNAAATSASRGDLGTVQGTASMLVLRKALDVQAAAAIALLDALPRQPVLATEGHVGRNVNVYA